MDKYQLSEIRAKEFYADYAEKYADTEDVGFGFAEHYGRSVLNSICNRFDKKISILDLGCGKGRHLPALTNYKKVTCIDASPDMLRHARKLKDKKTEFIQGNIHSIDYDSEFELVYSIGVLGLHAPFEERILQKLETALKPGGYLVFTTTRLAKTRKKLKRIFGDLLYPFAHLFLHGSYYHRRLLNFYKTPRQVMKLLKKSNFVLKSAVEYTVPGGDRKNCFWIVRKPTVTFK